MVRQNGFRQDTGLSYLTLMNDQEPWTWKSCLEKTLENNFTVLQKTLPDSASRCRTEFLVQIQNLESLKSQQVLKNDHAVFNEETHWLNSSSERPQWHSLQVKPQKRTW